MGAAKTYTEHYTLAEWELWQDDWELIEGVPYFLMNSSNIRHQVILGNMLFYIGSKADRKSNPISFVHCVNWRISNDTVLAPDIVLFRKPFPKEDWLSEAPLAIFEIFSPSTKNKDRTIKLDLYQSQKVKYYTMLDPETGTVEIYTLGEDGLYQKPEHGPEFTYTFDDCKVFIDFRKVWED